MNQLSVKGCNMLKVSKVSKKMEKKPRRQDTTKRDVNNGGEDDLGAKKMTKNTELKQTDEETSKQAETSDARRRRWRIGASRVQTATCALGEETREAPIISRDSNEGKGEERRH